MKITLCLGKSFLIALAVAMAFSCSVKAQSDSFDDGDDTVNPTWTHYDPVGDTTGIPGGSWTFPGSNTYRLQAFADSAGLGPGRIASTLTNAYSDFYSTVDVVDWDDTLDQAFGILARLENVGLGTTTGYVFTYQELDHTASISVINNEAATDLPATSTPITLFRTNSYRFVFTGQGTNFQGRIYQFPDTDNPIITVSGSDGTYSNGIGGLLAYDNSSGGGSTADVTYDNYFAASQEPPPVIVSIHNIAKSGVAANSIGVRFDRVVTLPSATNLANYVVNAGTVNLADVQLRPDGRSVEVTAGGPVGQFFSVCATNVQNLWGSSTLSITGGTVSDYTEVTLGTAGDPVADGQVFTTFWDTFDVNVGGSEIGGLDDHGHFIQQSMTGDFDVRVRVLQLDMADSASQAGLMARESLDANSASIQTFLTPTGGLNQIQATVRDVASNDAVDFLTSPPVTAAPNDWLRMTRSNDVFTTYYATNDTDWIVSGVTTQSFATNLYVGMATSAHTAATNTTARFTDFYPRGQRPGDEIHPTLSASRVGTNIVFKWPQTPRSYALEVATSLGASNEWDLLVLPVGFDLSNRVFQANLGVGLLGKTLFVRNRRVEKLIPDIPTIMLANAGITLSPDAGLLSNNTSGSLCGNQSVIAGTAFSQTNSYVLFPNIPTANAAIDAKNSSSGVSTVLKVTNNKTGVSGPLGCSYDATTVAAPNQSISRVALIPSFVSLVVSNKFTFVVGVKSPTAPKIAIQVYVTY